MSFEFKFGGVDDVLAKIKAIGSDMPTEAAGAMYEIAETIMAASQEIVPLDVGTLKNSKFVKPPKIRSKDITIEMGYGGQASDYAVVQHEDLSLNHQGQGEAKYLERPVMAAAPSFVSDLGGKLKSRLGL